MLALIAQNLAPIMFGALVIFFLLGYPVAFALAANGLLFFVVAVELAPYAPDNIALSWPLLQALPERVFGTMSNEVLLAIPFFTFMGMVLQRSGMAEDLLDTIGQLFGSVRGGLAYAVIFVGALLAATTGVVAASVISMGLISLPIMLRYGYDRRLATGVIVASGTLAQIVPPSIVLIVMADQLGRSVGDMYEGAFLPALILVGFYLVYVLIVSIVAPKSAPGLPEAAISYRESDGSRGVWQLGLLVVFSTVVSSCIVWQTGIEAGSSRVIFIFCIATCIALISTIINTWLGARHLIVGVIFTVALAACCVYFFRQDARSLALTTEALIAGATYAMLVSVIERLFGVRILSRMAAQVTFVMVPPLLLIFLVLGTIFIGLATPTEAGAMGAAGAVCLAAVKRTIEKKPARLNIALVKHAIEVTAKLSAFVLFILIGARVFSLTFYGVNGHLWVEHLLTALPGGQLGFLVFVNILVFLLAFFLDYFEIAFIILPLLVPVATKLGIDLIWFGVMLSVNIQTSFLHPPFGFALFYLRSVAPKSPYLDSVTKRRMEPVTTGQIYMGAIPFVVIQVVMVATVIFFPNIVLHHQANTGTGDAAATQKAIDKMLAPSVDDLDNSPDGDVRPSPQK